MSRQQFLVELSQYLTFVSPEDKEKIIAQYEKMFAAAGDDGVSALLAELGSPMKLTIELKRRKEAGEDIVPSEDGGEPEAPTMAEAVTDSEAAPMAEAAAEPVTEAETTPETESAPPTEAPSEPVAQRAEAAPEAEAIGEPEPASEAEAETEPDADALRKADSILEESGYSEPLDLTGAETISERTAHAAPLSGGKRVAAAIGSVLLSVLVCLVFVGIGTVGMLLIISMGDMIITGFGLFYRIADALLTIGIGLLGGAVGIVLVWFCVWCAVTLTGKLTGWMSVKKEAEVK